MVAPSFGRRLFGYLSLWRFEAFRDASDLVYLFCVVAALILTFSHFVLLPRITPGSGVLSSIFRRRPTPQEPSS